MIRFTCALALVSLLCCATFSESVAARDSHASLRSLGSKRRLEAVKRLESSPGRRSRASRAGGTSASPGVKNITFTIQRLPFYVDGTKIPLVDFDVGPSWSGLIPISDAANETGKLFFWLFPPARKEVQIISSSGSLQENGPFLWQRGQAMPTPNQYSWTNLSTILYIEQPIGTGFSQGTPTAKLKGKNLYLAGESNQFYIKTVWRNVLPCCWLNDHSVAAKCNYANYTEKYLTYPPRGLFPLPGTSTNNDTGCDVWTAIEDAALLVNPAFDIYHMVTRIHGASKCYREEQALCDCAGSPRLLFTADGTRIVLQNMTWGGMQGFQQPPTEDSFIVDGIGALGRLQSERGLTYVEIELSGHMVPMYSPIASFQLMEYLMGLRDSP
ncbi:Alpha/Beta hydrolase protein [Russula vinacea]|nr:Alpha/Beta hydrolase protein [Russula vinacea]